MLRNFLTQISRPLRSGFLYPSLPLMTFKNFDSTLINKTVEEWCKTLPEDQQKRIRLIQNEMALRQSEMKKIPRLDKVTVADYKEMLEMSTSRRQKYYYYLYVNKVANSHEELKKIIRDRTYEEKKAQGILGSSQTNHIDYGLGRNTLIMKINRQTINKWRNQKVFRAMILNQPPLVFDCGFNDIMSKYEIRDAARQLKYAFSENRLASRPFVMHLCNMKKDSQLWHELGHVIPNLNKLPIKVHSQDITEVFPTEKIVYLSPDAEDVLQEFSCNDTYIVGGLVDKAIRTPVTLAKAKRLNIRTARLPLDKYIKFHSHKTLTLDQMTKIMLELKRSQDWNQALKHVPTRKIFG